MELNITGLEELQPQTEPIVSSQKLYDLINIEGMTSATRDEIINWIWSLPVRDVPSNTEQCKTCKHKETRACMYHGYPETEIPPSCGCKLGITAEEAMRNLNGTFIDCWTKEHDARITANIIAQTVSILNEVEQFIKREAQLTFIQWNDVETYFNKKRSSFPTQTIAEPIAKECIGRFDECASNETCESAAFCIMASNNIRRSKRDIRNQAFEDVRSACIRGNIEAPVFRVIQELRNDR